MSQDDYDRLYSQVKSACLIPCDMPSAIAGHEIVIDPSVSDSHPKISDVFEVVRVWRGLPRASK
jgi:hypothetical protein